MSLKYYLYPPALTPDTDIQLVRLLCNLVRDIYCIVYEVLQSVTTIIAAVIYSILRAIFTGVSDKVTKGKPINLLFRCIDQGKMIAGRYISKLRQAFGTTTLRIERARPAKSGTYC